MSHCYFKNSPPPPFFFAAVSAEKWLHPVFMLELCSLWYLSSKLKAVSYQLSWRICCGKSRRLGPCHLNEKGGMWNSSEYCECMVGARSCGAGPLWQEFRGQKPSQASSSASAVISLPPTRFFPTGQLLQQLILRLPHANVSGSQPPLWCEVRSWLSFSRSSVPPPPHLLLKKTVVLSCSFLPEMILPRISSNLGMLNVFPSPASSSAQRPGLWLVPAVFCDSPPLVSGKLRCSCLASLLHALSWQCHSRPRFRDSFPSFRPARLLILALGFIRSPPWAVAVEDSVIHFSRVG